MTKKYYVLEANSPFRVGGERTSERRSREVRRKRRALTFFPRTLLPRLLSRATRAWLLWYPLNGDCASKLLGFHCCERWLHRHHNGSVNSKRTHPPKSIWQVLTSPLALNMSTREDLERSLTPSIPITFARFYLQLWEETALFLGKLELSFRKNLADKSSP